MDWHTFQCQYDNSIEKIPSATFYAGKPNVVFVAFVGYGWKCLILFYFEAYVVFVRFVAYVAYVAYVAFIRFERFVLF